jgi:hypothetical protein
MTARSPPPRKRPWLAGLTALWLLVTAGLLCASAWLGILAILVWPAWWLATLILILAHLIAALLGDRRLILRALGIVALVSFLAFPPQWFILGAMLRFLAERESYDTVVRTYLATGRLDPADGLYARIDPGPPGRLLFVWGQFGDNGNGVVWDPTGIVATARGWGAKPGDYTADPVAQELFGGDLVSCSHLHGHYYHCGYT